ncbi:Ethanolamine-phosphate cytidylyltransferase like protein [Aduncisulcus paluster]|uniref:ethanolamine-phosphate cytidylyltransferase n=1 Tax=Aduncisulcus paluster TaxID=2918883 RepID=A0ABQ5JV57_9EUKA|nr:Ethanolamine-phosphate cytidylyltransferase like protein [Aduncisulcus paluster]
MSDVNYVWVDGCFDMPHFGHFNLLRQASTYGIVIVGIHNDIEIERMKGKSPIFPMEDRALILSSCRFVHKVVMNAPWFTDVDIVKKNNCSVVIHADDEVVSTDGSDPYEKVKDLGMYITVNRTPGISSSNIIQTIITNPAIGISLSNLYASIKILKECSMIMSTLHFDVPSSPRSLESVSLKGEDPEDDDLDVIKTSIVLEPKPLGNAALSHKIGSGYTIGDGIFPFSAMILFSMLHSPHLPLSPSFETLIPVSSCGIFIDSFDILTVQHISVLQWAKDRATQCGCPRFVVCVLCESIPMDWMSSVGYKVSESLDFLSHCSSIEQHVPVSKHETADASYRSKSMKRVQQQHELISIYYKVYSLASLQFIDDVVLCDIDNCLSKSIIKQLNARVCFFSECCRDMMCLRKADDRPQQASFPLPEAIESTEVFIQPSISDHLSSKNYIDIIKAAVDSKDDLILSPSTLSFLQKELQRQSPLIIKPGLTTDNSSAIPDCVKVQSDSTTPLTIVQESLHPDYTIQGGDEYSSLSAIEISQPSPRIGSISSNPPDKLLSYSILIAQGKHMVDDLEHTLQIEIEVVENRFIYKDMSSIVRKIINSKGILEKIEEKERREDDAILKQTLKYRIK